MLFRSLNGKAYLLSGFSLTEKKVISEDSTLPEDTKYFVFSKELSGGHEVSKNVYEAIKKLGTAPIVDESYYPFYYFKNEIGQLIIYRKIDSCIGKFEIIDDSDEKFVYFYEDLWERGEHSISKIDRFTYEKLKEYGFTESEVTWGDDFKNL